MFCPKCGTYVEAGRSTCPACGNRDFSGSMGGSRSSQKSTVHVAELGAQVGNSYTAERIDLVAKIFGGIDLLATIVCAIVFGRSIDKYGDTAFNFWLFLLILVAGAAVAFTKWLLLHGLSCSIEASTVAALNSAENLKRIDKIEKKLEEMDKKTEED